MDKAKAAVSGFMSKSGKHDTTVHQNVNPSVTHETVNPERREEVTTALDKEIHQDHYHTSVQPIQHQEVLPEQHHHNTVAVEHRHHEHGDKSKVAQKLEQEAAQFKDQSRTVETKHTTTTAPSVTGEHVHHHVHENIQPVIQKDVYQPHVVHTVVPIHEVHHNEAQHHTGSTLPPMTMDEYKKHGGSLTGAGEFVDRYGGEPRTIGGSLPEHRKTDTGVGGMRDSDVGHSRDSGVSGLNDSRSGIAGQHAGLNDPQSTSRTTHGGVHNGMSDASGTRGTHSGLNDNHTPIADQYTKGHSGTTGSTPNAASAAATSAATAAGSRGTDSSGLHHQNVTGSSAPGSRHSHDTQDAYGTGSGLRDTHSSSSASTGTSGKTKKPSLMDRLNPKKDADGDGKAGFMS